MSTKLEPTTFQLAFERACATDATTCEREVDHDYPNDVFRLCVKLKRTGDKARVNVAHGTTNAGTYWIQLRPSASDWAAILFELAYRIAVAERGEVTP